ncbi:MAG: archaeosortase/exosortase family protein [Zestosphaera sp.]
MREYRGGLIAGYLVVVSLIALLLQSIYREYVESVVKLMFTEDYSYLLVSFITVVFVLYLSLRYMGFTYEIQPSRLLASAFLVVTSTILYHVSKLVIGYSLSILGLSFAIAMMSILILVFKPVTIGDVVPVLTPLFTVPIPTSVIDVVTTNLSRVVGRVAAALTSTEFIDTGAFAIIKVETSQGPYLLSVEAACSGILTLSTVIVIFPLLAYYATSSREKALKKLGASLLALLAGLLVGFLGNLVRVVIIVFTAKYHSVDVAVGIFHYSPSVIYASISVVLAYVIIDRVTQVRFIIPEPVAIKAYVPELRWGYVSGILVSAVVIVLLMQSLVAVTADAGTTNASHVVVEVGNLDEAVNNLSTYLFSSEVRVLRATYDDFLTRVSGALATYRVRVIIDDTVYQGYLEVVDIPARFHTLQLCVSLQGFKILNSWSESRNTLQLSHITMEKSNSKYILSYTLIPVIVKTIGSEQILYARVSVFRPYDTASDLEAARGALIKALNISEGQAANLENESLNVLSIVGVVLFVTLVSYILVVYVYRYAQLIKMRS